MYRRIVFAIAQMFFATATLLSVETSSVLESPLLGDESWPDVPPVLIHGTELASYAECEPCAPVRKTASRRCAPTTCNPCLQNLSLFAGLEGSKQPQDFGVNAHFGGRFHANMGLPLIKSHGIGVQIGTATNYTDNAVQVVERIEGNKERFQSFTTLGVFQRRSSGLSWAVGYDYLFQNYYDDFSLGQWRADIGFRFNPCNEFGAWMAFSSRKDRGLFSTIPVVLDPITQGSLYWRRTWENDSQTTLWIGLAEGHGEANVALGDLPPVGERFTFGADVFVPLSPKLAMFGQANFIAPSDTGTVDAFLGMAYFPGGSHGARERTYAPRLSVANNTTFANDLSR